MDNEKVQIFNDLFSSVFNTEIEDPTLNIGAVHTLEDMVPLEIRTEDIVKRLNKLKINKSCGPDKLHPRILKETCQQIALPLKKIYECSLRNNVVPDDWRSGYISAIFKKGKKKYDREL